MAVKQHLIRNLPGLKEHVVMRDFTTWHIGGVADFFIVVNTIDEFVKTVKAALSANIPYFILGGGSNVLFSDYGFPGLVIKNQTSNVAILKDKSQVIVDSGVPMSKLIMQAGSCDLAGLEFLYGIPGTIGGAIYCNAGAHGSAIGDYVKSLTILNPDSDDSVPKIEQVEPEWLQSEYRSTRLKNMKVSRKPIILSVKLQLAQSQKEEIMRRLKKYQDLRSQRQPVGLMAGCVFKNNIPKELKNVTGKGTKGMPELPRERTAGFMLHESGVKKMRIGEAEVSSKHANFILNLGNAKANDVRALIEEMREKVRQKYDVTLEEEIEYIGQW